MEHEKEDGTPLPSFKEQVGTRLREVEKKFPNRETASKIAGVAKSTLQNWIEGNSDPSFEGLSRLADAANVSLDWLAYGQGQHDVDMDAEFVRVPRYDVKLAAGAGAFNERAPLLDYIPFTRDFLAKKLARNSTDGLVLLEVRGDSMEPTIGDGDLVLIDQLQADLEDGIMAYTLDDTAYVKRIRSIPGGIEVISDNRAVYPPYELTQSHLSELRIIGRVRWIGRVLGR